MEFKEYRNYFGTLTMFGIVYGTILMNCVIEIMNVNL